MTEISFARLFSFSTVILLFLSVDPLCWPPCLQDGSVSVDVLDCCCMSIIDGGHANDEAADGHFFAAARALSALFILSLEIQP